ncbi:uncharacterized protein EDB91DRAFT_1254944 [Suillus paluster]|uniref:uncharacterized protein n=1 Tax=Suillus paluster TaxID=48578 RepID=UPI001B87E354|nr:uncharacterized protein EDB91DRAFT_1254944 [Suillus paluster]KAG1725084.1 hypothetical protein EDB91DRAFT_1254944 [Suillus paluster]
MQSSISSRQSDIDKLLLRATISSLGVPSGPRTLDTTQALVKEELKNRLIHEGIGRGARIPLKNSIFYQLILKTTLQLGDIKTIQYDKTGPSAYSGGKWKFHCRWKRIKRTHGAKYVDDSTEDNGTEDEDTEGEDTEDDEDGDTDIDDAEIEGTVLGVEVSFDSVIPGQSESETWDSQEYQPSGSRKRRRQVPVTTEKDFRRLFYTIQYHLCHKLIPHLLFNIPPGSRYWSAEFATSPIPDEYNSPKPDIALFDFALKNMEKTWADVLSFVEHTSSDLGKKRDIPVFWGSTIKAYLIMRDQPWRRFVVVFSICANQLRAHYLDRSGLIISYPFHIHENTGPIRLTEMLGTLTLSDSHHLGFDPTMHMCNAACVGTHLNLAHEAKGWVKDNLNQMYSIMEVLWKSHGLFCRGTVCYRVVDEAGNEYALKDCWVTEEKRNHEATILEMVKGIPNVVQLIDHWDVYYEGEPDCTARIRSQYDTNHRDDLAFCNRFHRRILLSPCGQPLSKFSSRQELLTAFHAFVVAHHAMIRNRVLHGDLSPNNFVIHNGIGYFIDFDHALILAEGTTSAYSHGTGTMPYISIRILQAMLDLLVPLEVNVNIPNDVNSIRADNIDVGENIDFVPQDANAPQDANVPQNVAAGTHLIEHRPSDDLESLFYIFFEFVVMYGGPHGQLAPTWSLQTLPWACAYEALGKVALSTICYAKMGALMQSSFFIAKTSEYFAEFRPLVQNWVTMVYSANRREDSVEMTHAGVLGILDVFMRSIGNKLPPSGQSQSLHPQSVPLTLRTPPAGPSEPLLRRSARLSTSLAPHPSISTAGPSEPSSRRSKKSKRTTRKKH